MKVLFLELRFLLSCDGKDGNQLPPTVGTLIPHMTRETQKLGYKMSIKSRYTITNQLFLGEISSNGNFTPVRCVNLQLRLLY